MRLVSEKDYLAHHGIKGQKWGVRRYRNEDGTLTDLGKKRLARDSSKLNKAYADSDKKFSKALKRSQKLAKYSKRPRWLMDDEITTNKAKRFERADRRYVKSLQKAEKIFNEMSKKYSDINIIEASPEVARKGAEVMIRLRERKALGAYVVSGFGSDTGNVIQLSHN